MPIRFRTSYVRMRWFMGARQIRWGQGKDSSQFQLRILGASVPGSSMGMPMMLRSPIIVEAALCATGAVDLWAWILKMRAKSNSPAFGHFDLLPDGFLYPGPFGRILKVCPLNESFH